ncbi:MAG: ADP-ribosylglycohydrolase family protein [Natronospirillum sp.]
MQPNSTEASLLERKNIYRGCLLGGAVGDALGAAVEFATWPQIQERFGEEGIRHYAEAYGGVGLITDDTQMTMFTADGLLRTYCRSNTKGIAHFPSVLSHAYLRWLKTQGYESLHPKVSMTDGWLIKEPALFAQRAPGTTCLNALKAIRVFGDTAQNDRKGCGAVMRVAPIGLFNALRTEEEVSNSALHDTFSMAVEAAQLTHGHPTGYLATGAFASIIHLLVCGEKLDDVVRRILDIYELWPGFAETHQALSRAVHLANSAVPPQEAIADLGEGWVAEEALAIAVYCALKANDFDHGIRMAVNHGGDSDSTGSMAGQLMGASLGIDAINPVWLEPLELRNAIQTLADDLAEAPFWCFDDDTELHNLLMRYPPY